MYYSICDLCVKMIPGNITLKNAEKYKITGEHNADIIIDSSLETAIKELPNIAFDKTRIYMSESKDFYRKLLNFNGTYIHSSAVVVDGKAYLFSAPCGTGKSTHTSKWLELFGDKAYIINDDKPAIRILDDGIYVYGTPWSGKHDISVNKKAKLQGICFLTRDNNNWIKPYEGFEVFTELYTSSLKKITRDELQKQMAIFDKIIERIPTWKMGCTPTIDAAKVAYDTMKEPEV